jgi:hypothetical protein
MQRKLAFAFGLAASVVAAQASASVTLKLVKQLDMAQLNAGQPGSVAARGNHLYVGSLFGGATLYHIVDPVGATQPAVAFGGINDAATNGGLANAGGTSNGYVSLHTDGVTLIAGTENGGATPDIAQAYQFGTTTLKWGANSGFTSLNTQTNRIDGIAVDPISGNVMSTGFGGDLQNFYSAASGAPVAVPGANILFYPGVGTGWKDVAYDQATGDIYLRAVGGVARGQRIADGRFQTLEGGAGVQTIVDGVNDFASAINVEYLPSSFAGQQMVILNVRGNPNTFADQVKLFSATPPSAGGTATDTPIAVSFVLGDGVTPFDTTLAGSGIYDFSYDPINNLLYVSDFSSSQVHIFSNIPEPATAAVLAGAALVLLRRRGA